MLEVKVLNSSNAVLTGRFDASQADMADKALEAMTGNCILDCSGLDYISSAGIGVILATYKRLDDHGGTLTMTKVNPLITQVFRYAGLATLFGIDLDNAKPPTNVDPPQ